jgi:hypothetical protein
LALYGGNHPFEIEHGFSSVKSFHGRTLVQWVSWRHGIMRAGACQEI